MLSFTMVAMVCQQVFLIGPLSVGILKVKFELLTEIALVAFVQHGNNYSLEFGISGVNQSLALRQDASLSEQ